VSSPPPTSSTTCCSAARPGAAAEDQAGAYEKWRGALRLPAVRGPVVGRTLLYPADGDVAAAVDTAAGLL
jgi:hypothetical protein